MTLQLKDKNGGSTELTGCSGTSAMLNQGDIYELQMERSSAENVDARTAESTGENTVSSLGYGVEATADILEKSVEHLNTFNLSKDLLQSASDGSQPTIKDFMAKPYLLDSGVFSVNDVGNSFSMFHTSMALKQNPAYYEKLTGILAVRYTTVVTLQVNANKFQQGYYKLCFLGTGGMELGPNAVGARTNWINSHRANRSQISQLYGVDFYLSTDTSVQLKIPFISSFPSLNYSPYVSTTTLGDPGVFFIYPMSALKSGPTVTNPGYSLWVHYEDFETLGNASPNVGGDPWAPPAPPPVQGEVQSGYRRKVVRKRNVDLITEERNEDGPISSSLRITTSALETLSGIPLLTSYVTPMAWATGVLAKVASAFGYSKPLQLDSLVRVKSSAFNYLPNADQKDDSVPLGLISTNHVNIAPGFAGTNDDEMAIDYIKSVYGLIKVQNWSSADAPQTLLYSVDLYPTNFTYDGPGTTVGILNYTPVGYASTFFEQYTGGFEFRVKFSKTQFHSGRLMICFNPREASVSKKITTFDSAPYLQRLIIDVRDKDEVSFIVPYVSVIPWRPVRIDGTSYSPSYGSLDFYVLDALSAPDTVANNIDFFIEVRGAADMRFAVPCNFRTVVAVPGELQSGTSSTTNLNAHADIDLSNGGAQDTNLSKEEYCIGEAVTSFRQLLKRGGFLVGANTDTPTCTFARVFPWAWRCEEPTDGTDLQIPNDPYARLSCIYSMVRGGMRIKFLSETNTGGIYCYLNRGIADNDTRTVYPIEVGNVVPLAFILESGGAQITMEKAYMGGVSVQIPFYHYTHSSPTGALCSSTNAPGSLSLRSGAVVNRLYMYFSEPVKTAQLYLYRSGADDCTFGGFVSVPPVRTNT